MILINENPTFLDRLNRGDSHFNIYSGSKNYVVDRISNDRYKVTPGKGFDKGADAYIKKCYIPGSDNEVTRNALTNFIKMINRKNGYREDIDTEELRESTSVNNKIVINENATRFNGMTDDEIQGRCYCMTNLELNAVYKEIFSNSTNKDRSKDFNRQKKIDRIISIVNDPSNNKSEFK